jgi:hypothetical protein
VLNETEWFGTWRFSARPGQQVDDLSNEHAATCPAALRDRVGSKWQLYEKRHY